MKQPRRGQEMLLDLLPRRKQPKPGNAHQSASPHTSRSSSISSEWPSATYGEMLAEIDAAEAPMPEIDTSEATRAGMGLVSIEIDAIESSRAEMG